MNRKPKGPFPSRYPIDVTEDLWFYEYHGSISVVMRGSGQGRIPLRQLALIVDRYRTYRKRRNRK